MLEFALEARHGSFCLEVECVFCAEWTVVFGPSGAGKSMMLRLLAGLAQAQNAKIALDGRELAESARGFSLRPGLRRISMVSQHPALFPHLSVRRNVGYGIRGLDRASHSDRVEEMLELAGGQHLIDRRPRELSGGEAQRVALARALATMPRLLLLDEPFSALDGVASDVLLARLQKWVSAHQVQTVMATHDATDALTTNAEVALLRDGKLAAQGPAAHVLAAECERLLNRIGKS